jgi:hypothetical protein
MSSAKLRLCALAVLAFAALALAAPSAQAAFGFKAVDLSFTEADESDATLAGSHPFAMTATVDFNTKIDPEKGEVVDDFTKDLIVDLPAGFVVNPTAVPYCSNADFLASTGEVLSLCPDAAAVGTVEARQPGALGGDKAAVYNLEPTFGEPAKLGFHILGVTVILSGGIRNEGDYHAFSTLLDQSQAEEVSGATLVLWGNPADPAHDEVRGNCFGEPQPGGCPAQIEGTPIPPTPYITLPRSCTGPLETLFRADSWADPGSFVEATATGPEMEGCEDLGFGPVPSIEPSTQSAESSSGLDFDLEIDDPGFTEPEERADSDVKAIRVTLPEGVTVNPSAGEVLGSCTAAQFAAESLSAAAGEGCPANSKLGTLQVTTPLLAEPLGGSLYLAQQDDPATTAPGAENPFDSMLALYTVIESPRYGIFVKQAGLVEADPATGQLTTTFAGLPQLPFSGLHLHFFDGPRAALVTPPACGSYQAEVQLTPWAAPEAPLQATASFTVSSGIAGGPCPAGERPFAPGFGGGTLDNTAGSYSPLVMKLTRSDADQEITRLSAILPPGLLGKLAGVAKCPEEAIAAAGQKSGRAEQATPSCPASSQLGHVLAGAGVGSALTYVPGTIYLAGPFGGDPLSVVVITPAVAGPVDAGTVVIREALTLNPLTAQVEIDGAASDPIPRILKGIPLKLRDLRVAVDRPGFTLNPTNCNPLRIAAAVTGSPSLASPSVPFNATACAALAFRPALKLRLSGGTHRNSHPKLRAELRARPGDANISGATVLLPHSMFLEQGHIRTICTRVQFAAKACPKGSVYGHARATTPLLDEPLEGPVYLRANGGERELPDLVADLRGIVEIEVVGFIDSRHARLRSRFQSVPDAPVTKFVLTMQGQKKGLIAASENLCAKKQRAHAVFRGQNGRRRAFNPKIAVAGCG